MPSTDAVPVIVVGAGPVGQTAALLLARWGVPVLLVDERAGREAVGSKAICQQRDVLDVWEAVGVGGRLAKEGVTWSTARIFWRDQEVASWRSVDRGDSPFPAFVNISQARTEQALDEAIEQTPLITTRWGWGVTGLDQDDDGVTLTCQYDGEVVHLRSQFVVLCCGARGAPLRAQLGVAFPGESYEDRFLICDIRAELGDWAHERRFYFDPVWNPGRQVLIHACPGSVFRIDWQVPNDFDLTHEEKTGGLARRIEQVVGGADYEVVWQSVYRFHARVASRMRVGRVLLAGDMAHVVAPFGARGLNSGIADAENAAWKIAFVLGGWGGPDLLESYHVERHAAALENLEVTEATMRFLVPRTDDERRARQLALSEAAVDGNSRTQINSGRFAEPFWYVDSPLTTADPARPFPGRPDLGHAPAPGPGILVPDARIADDAQWLRRIARDGFLLLTGDGVDAAAITTQASIAVSAPIRVEEVTRLDPSGALGELLDVKRGEVWVVRPDAHVAAIAHHDEPDSLAAALRRAAAGGPRATAPAHGRSTGA